ncbi:hypothetical protein [Bdellovibrio sp. HCB337]|uniref:hypothetical protein n=1 Tax=Bdellovibrio sp. HCB337 TaxID=3394358 RepID=UPI0039A5357F
MSSIFGSLLACLFHLSVLPSEASIYSGPIGEQEAYLGNAGAALEDSVGNLLLNPAGLAFTQKTAPSASMSGNTLGFETTRSPGFYKSSTSFTSRTLLAAGVFPTEAWDGYFAMFYSEPINDSNIGITNSGTFELNSSTTAGGVAAGYRHSDTLGFGLSGSISFQIVDTYLTRTQSSPGFSSLSYEREQIKNYSLLLTPGVLWRPISWWKLGVSLNWRPFSLEQEGLAYRTSQSSAGADLSETARPFNPDIKNTYDATLGQSFALSENYLLLLDMTYRPEFSYSNDTGERWTEDSFKSLSVGLKIHANFLVDLLGGYSRSESDFGSANLVTLGFAINRQNNSLLLGLYYKDNTLKGDFKGQSSSGGLSYAANISYF